MKNTGLPFLLFDALLLLFVIVVDKGVYMQECIERCGHGTICNTAQCGNSTCSQCICKDGFKNPTTIYDGKSTTVYCKEICDGSGSNCPSNSGCFLRDKTCECSHGYTRSSLGRCIESCANNEICPENTTCQLFNSVYMCECSVGFIKSTSGQCVENDCGGQCGNGTMCNRTTGECSCMEGYTDKRKQNDGMHTVYHCTESCAANKTCPDNTTCQQPDNSVPMCECSVGFLRSTSGQCVENDCGGQCGHGTECHRRTGNCSCTKGFADRRKLVGRIHTVYYCTAVCEQGELVCPPNTTCSLEYPYNQTTPQYRCQCSPGFKRSYPGLCLGDGSDVRSDALTEKPGPNNPSQPTAKRNRDPESNDLTFALAVGIGGGLLVILVVSVVVVVLLRRKSSSNNKRDASSLSPHYEDATITTTAAAATTTTTTNFNLSFEDENKFQTNMSYVSCELNTSVGVGENLVPSCSPGNVNGGAHIRYEEIDLPFLSNSHITHPDSITGDKEHIRNAEVSIENCGADEKRQREAVYDTIHENRESEIPSKIYRPELYSNHKIPYTKEVQKAQRKQSVDDMSLSNYNTLYDLTLDQTNEKNDKVQPEVAQTDSHFVVYDTVRENAGDGIPALGMQHQNEVECDRLITHKNEIQKSQNKPNVAIQNCDAAEKRQVQLEVVYNTIPESRGTGVPSKIDVQDFYSNHKIPYTKELQKAQRKQSVDDMSSSHYNTLYDLTLEQTNGKNGEVQPEVAQTDNVPQNIGDEKPAFEIQPQNEVEYDRLKLPTV